MFGWARLIRNAKPVFGLAVVVAGLQSLSAEDIPVRVGYSSSIHSIAAKVLSKTDIPKKHGLNAEFTFFQYGPPQIEGLVSKTLDVSFTSVIPTASYLEKQAGAVKVIAELGSSIHGVVVQGDSPFKSLADLKGHSIGLPFGSDSHADLLLALKRLGLDPAKDVKLQNLAPNEQAAAFQQKLVDAVLVRPPVLARLQKELHAREIQEWPHQLWVIARADYLKEHPEAEARLVAAIKDAVIYANQHLEEAAGWYAEDLRQKTPVVIEAAKINPIFTLADPQSVKLEPSPKLRAFAQKRARELVEIGLNKKQVDFFPE
jgi:ABC-type nitrate/sulfonate/bicarbonate transport system substrate-binding protein